MRQVKTFILRLYVDTQSPTRLCGDLQPLPRQKAYPFMDEAGLETLLRKLVREEKDLSRMDTDNIGKEINSDKSDEIG
jgi:hypothetical protein